MAVVPHARESHVLNPEMGAWEPGVVAMQRKTVMQPTARGWVACCTARDCKGSLEPVEAMAAAHRGHQK